MSLQVANCTMANNAAMCQTVIRSSLERITSKLRYVFVSAGITHLLLNKALTSARLYRHEPLILTGLSLPPTRKL